MTLQDKRILLVEDEIIIGFALDDMLSGEGARTTLASSKADAEQALGETRFDMAIIDVNLHGDVSYPLADMLADRGCPFIFATGYGSVTHPPRFAGVPTVNKPYDLTAILRALEAIG
ncbi:MAG: response regulator [Erythrobacter sp.]|nr:MAG: response regulator [Erythrobacter sp.]